MKRLYDSREYRRNRKIVLKQANYVCSNCGGHANTADHIVPQSMEDSSNRLGNLRAMCLSCNSSRGNQLRHKPKRRTRINAKWF